MKNKRNRSVALMIILLCCAVLFPSAPASAQSGVIDWNPTWDSNLGAAAAPARAPITSWLVRQNGMLTRDGEEFIFFGTGLNQASTAIGATSYMSDNDMQKTLQRIAAQGFNAIRLQGMDSKDMTVSAANYGAWAGPSGPDFSETFMVQLDKTIARANTLGLQIWIGSFNFAQAVTRIAQLPTGTTGANGMGWSAQFRQIEKNYILRFANRVNTQTGVKYIDNPGIVWQPDNENGFSNAYFSHVGWFDQLLDPTNANSYWKPELDAKVTSYYAAKGWVLPANQFPHKTVYDGWPAADKQHFMKFMGDTDVEYASDIYNWFKSLNPNVIVDVNTFNYMDGRVLNSTDIASYHSYARVPAGDAITVPPNYVTRSSILQDNNGWNWSWVMGGSRSPNVPFVVPEAGDYGLNRWDYERTILEAVVHSLQQTSGLFVFNESQSLYQAKATGIQSIHHHVGWPSRRLATMLAAPIVEHRLIAPLPDENVAVLDPVLYNVRQAEKGVAALNSYSFQNGWDGSERGYWLKRLYTDFGAPQNTAGYPKVLDATFAAGIQVTNQVFVKNTGVTVNAPAVVGLVNDLKNTTIGPMSLSGVTPTANAVVMIRSDGNYPLFSGPAKLFVHQNSTVTDAAGFTGTVDGETVTSWGSQANTRLVVPTPFTISFATGGTELDVSGVNDDGTIVPIATVFDPATGTVRFATDTRFPLYLVMPQQTVPPSTTPTPTATVTATPTSPAPTNTPSPTATATPTNTPSPTATATPTNMPSPSTTPTATLPPTSTPSATPASTPTTVPTALPSTGYKPPSADEAVTTNSGDNDGFDSQARSAYMLDNNFAVDSKSGTGGSTSYTSEQKDRHMYAGFGLAVPPGASIKGIQVRLDAKADSTGGSPRIYVQLSRDGGLTWLQAKATPVLSTTETTYVLGGTTDTWGQGWSAEDANGVRIRITNVASNKSRSFLLDYVAVQVTYQ